MPKLNVETRMAFNRALDRNGLGGGTVIDARSAFDRNRGELYTPTPSLDLQQNLTHATL